MQSNDRQDYADFLCKANARFHKLVNAVADIDIGAGLELLLIENDDEVSWTSSLSCVMDWSNTPQGVSYWSGINNKLILGGYYE